MPILDQRAEVAAQPWCSAHIEFPDDVNHEPGARDAMAKN
jgi:hypothetical protein